MVPVRRTWRTYPTFRTHTTERTQVLRKRQQILARLSIPSVLPSPASNSFVSQLSSEAKTAPTLLTVFHTSQNNPNEMTPSRTLSGKRARGATETPPHSPDMASKSRTAKDQDNDGSWFPRIMDPKLLRQAIVASSLLLLMCWSGNLYRVSFNIASGARIATVVHMDAPTTRPENAFDNTWTINSSPRIRGTTPQLQSSNPADTRPVKIALFMTTHFSDQHIQFLTRCWPEAVKRFQLLQQADLLLYTPRDPPTRLLSNLTGFHNVTIKKYYQPDLQGASEYWRRNGLMDADWTTLETPELQQQKRQFDALKQRYAIQSMIDGFLPHHRWFDEYDWVIRLNPDVVIRDDTFLANVIYQQPPVYDLVYVQCNWNQIHTDFTAFRPAAVREYDHQLILNAMLIQNAEQHLHDSWYPIIHSNRSIALPGAYANNFYCRTVGNQSSVAHVHAAELLESCPNYFDTHGTHMDGESMAYW